MNHIYKKILIPFFAVLLLGTSTVQGFSNLHFRAVLEPVPMSLQNQGDIYIEDFIEDVLQPLVDRVNPTATVNFNINYDILRERLQQRPYITYFTTHTTSTLFGGSETFEHWFQSHTSFTEPHVNMVETVEGY